MIKYNIYNNMLTILLNMNLFIIDNALHYKSINI